MAQFDVIVAGGTLVLAGELIPRGVLVTRGREISYSGDAAGAPSGAAWRKFDASGCWVVPGLIDLHVHGAAGHDPTLGGLKGLSATLARHGVSSFLPTLAPGGDIVMATRSLAAELAREMPGASPLGLHLEGPYLSPRYPGCLDPTSFLLPDVSHLDALAAAANGAIKRMTLAVELPGAEAVLARLSGLGIHPSLGHSGATYEDVARAVSLGLRQATHTFNAMSGFHHRAPGAAGAVLLKDEIIAEVIADGCHVERAALALLFRVKGPGRIVLASDAVPPAGLPAGKHEWRGREVFLSGCLCLDGQQRLAGSGTLLDGALRFVMDDLGLSPTAAVTMASLTPAVALGLAHRKGSLAAGKDADFAIFDRNWRCRATAVGGKVVWERNGD